MVQTVEEFISNSVRDSHFENEEYIPADERSTSIRNDAASPEEDNSSDEGDTISISIENGNTVSIDDVRSVTTDDERIVSVENDSDICIDDVSSETHEIENKYVFVDSWCLCVICGTAIGLSCLRRADNVTICKSCRRAKSHKHKLITAKTIRKLFPDVAECEWPKPVCVRRVARQFKLRFYNYLEVVNKFHVE
jgi:RNA polymerase-binding transcription factor DksA